MAASQKYAVTLDTDSDCTPALWLSFCPHRCVCLELALNDQSETWYYDARMEDCRMFASLSRGTGLDLTTAIES